MKGAALDRREWLQINFYKLFWSEMKIYLKPKKYYGHEEPPCPVKEIY